MLGKPFFVTKEWFPQTPSKKVILDIAGHHRIILCASATWETCVSIRENKKNGNGENEFSPVPFFCFHSARGDVL